MHLVSEAGKAQLEHARAPCADTAGACCMTYDLSPHAMLLGSTWQGNQIVKRESAPVVVGHRTVLVGTGGMAHPLDSSVRGVRCSTIMR